MIFPGPSNAKDKVEPDIFGFYQQFERVERGWLTSETAIQIKLFNNPIELWKAKLKGRPVRSKLTDNILKCNLIYYTFNNFLLLFLKQTSKNHKSTTYHL